MFDPDAIPDEALPALAALLDHLRACRKRREKEQAAAEQQTEPAHASLYSESTTDVRGTKR